jgi:16S rRNA (uracil1498-N3)-methyltransferase
MLHVVRVSVGDEVILFDGNGSIVTARLAHASKREAQLEALSREVVDVEPSRALTLACALPRGPRMDWLVEKCTELGVARIIPMITQHSVVDPGAREEHHQQRWQRIVVEATKQCGRARLLQIASVQRFEDVVADAPSDVVRLIASPEPDAVSIAEFSGQLAPNQPLTAFVGPEGGFSPNEVAAARHRGSVTVSLGPRILRIETAAVALAAHLLLGR